ncbi:MAG: hypothetical protein H6756_02435 [Candidatus Omnitrophica bacterium]|nr:hypothetical protein [Candidatus Omnitrophota bacterium]
MIELITPIHPKLVHFPIALFVSAVVFELLSIVFRREGLHKTAVNMYILAALVTPLVVRTGIWEAERLNLNHPILDAHRKYALWTMWGSLMSLPVLWLLKKEFTKYFRVIFFLILIGVVSVVSLAGHNGGTMVYEYGVGIEE